jgi:hypothetical protein
MPLGQTRRMAFFAAAGLACSLCVASVLAGAWARNRAPTTPRVGWTHPVHWKGGETNYVPAWLGTLVDFGMPVGVCLFFVAGGLAPKDLRAKCRFCGTPTWRGDVCGDCIVNALGYTKLTARNTLILLAVMAAALAGALLVVLLFEGFP